MYYSYFRATFSMSPVSTENKIIEREVNFIILIRVMVCGATKKNGNIHAEFSASQHEWLKTQINTTHAWASWQDSYVSPRAAGCYTQCYRLTEAMSSWGTAENQRGLVRKCTEDNREEKSLLWTILFFLILLKMTILLRATIKWKITNHLRQLRKETCS